MNTIELGHMLTPPMASARGIQLVYQREAHGISIVLYREPRPRSGDVWLVTVRHIVSTLTTLEKVAMYAFSHS